MLLHARHYKTIMRACIACRMPGVMTQHMALLVPHLGGKAHALRSAIVTVCACLISHLSGDLPTSEHSSAHSNACAGLPWPYGLPV